jgi:hypothetical protein
VKRALLLPLALAACGESPEPQQKLVAAARQGLYAVKAAPGGALALFSDVTLHGETVVCGTVDAQDGGGRRRFAVVVGGEPVIEGSGDPTAAATIARTCQGPSRKVTSRNPGYSDLEIEDQR